MKQYSFLKKGQKTRTKSSLSIFTFESHFFHVIFKNALQSWTIHRLTLHFMFHFQLIFVDSVFSYG